MASVGTIDLDWEPDVDDPDDSLDYEIYAVVDARGFYWGGATCCWTWDRSEAKRYWPDELPNLFAIIGVGDLKIIEL